MKKPDKGRNQQSLPRAPGIQPDHNRDEALRLLGCDPPKRPDRIRGVEDVCIGEEKPADRAASRRLDKLLDRCGGRVDLS